jgi:hypothetical protein
MSDGRRQKVSYARGSFSGFRKHIAVMVEGYNRDHVGRMPKIVIDDKRYLAIEKAGKFRAFMVFADDKPAGIITYIIGTSRHYAPDYLIAIHDFFYVLPEHRAGIIPVNLYRVAEAGLAHDGIARIFMVDHTRFISRGAAYKRMGYTEVEITYEKVLKAMAPGSKGEEEPGA